MGTHTREDFVFELASNKFLSLKDKKSLFHLYGIQEPSQQILNGGKGNDSDVTDVSSSHGEKVVKHNPCITVDFLKQFSRKDSEALKYTVHSWDSREGDYASFDSFMSAVNHILDGSQGIPLNLLRSQTPHLFQIIYTFLLKKDDTPNSPFCWVKSRNGDILKLGYGFCHDYLDQWMNDNPTSEPMAMPLSRIPVKYLPKGQINGKTLSYWSDVVEVFKHLIEFRDDKLYLALRRIFTMTDHRVTFDRASIVSGSFYTDTERVKEAFALIKKCIATRSEYPEVYISASSDESTFQMSILHKDSFSDKSIDYSKLVAENGDGDLYRIKEKLFGLCDFAVESRFYRDGVCLPLRINYLIDPSSNRSKYEQIQKCEGFKYILTFYK